MGAGWLFIPGLVSLRLLMPLINSFRRWASTAETIQLNSWNCKIRSSSAAIYIKPHFDVSNNYYPPTGGRREPHSINHNRRLIPNVVAVGVGSHFRTVLSGLRYFRNLSTVRAELKYAEEIKPGRRSSDLRRCRKVLIDRKVVAVERSFRTIQFGELFRESRMKYLSKFPGEKVPINRNSIARHKYVKLDSRTAHIKMIIEIYIAAFNIFTE